MATDVLPLSMRPAWTDLREHHAEIRDVHLRDLFAADPGRGERLAAEAAGIYLDYSKNRVTDETLGLLVRLARESGLAERIEAMFTGERINVTEDRAVLHTALRAPAGAVVDLDGENVVPEVHAVLDRMAEFAGRLRDGTFRGHTGKRIRTVVNIGIGGSDLGPAMAYEALRHYAALDLECRFVSNVDATDFALATRGLDPAETLFVVASKTFTTLETMTNARTARDWLLSALGDEDPSVRSYAFSGLGTLLRSLFPYRRLDMTTIRYHPTGPPAERSAAAKRLRSWWAENRGKGW